MKTIPYLQWGSETKKWMLWPLPRGISFWKASIASKSLPEQILQHFCPCNPWPSFMQQAGSTPALRFIRRHGKGKRLQTQKLKQICEFSQDDHTKSVTTSVSRDRKATVELGKLLARRTDNCGAPHVRTKD